jgi:hypothetical protein
VAYSWTVCLEILFSAVNFFHTVAFLSVRRLFERPKPEFYPSSLDTLSEQQTYVQNLNATASASLSAVHAVPPLACVLPPPPKQDLRLSPGASNTVGCSSALASPAAAFRQQPPPMKVLCSLMYTVSCSNLVSH